MFRFELRICSKDQALFSSINDPPMQKLLPPMLRRLRGLWRVIVHIKALLTGPAAFIDDQASRQYQRMNATLTTAAQDEMLLPLPSHLLLLFICALIEY